MFFKELSLLKLNLRIILHLYLCLCYIIIGHPCVLLHSRYVTSANVMDTTWVSDDGAI